MIWLDKLLSDIRFWGAYSLSLIVLLFVGVAKNPLATFREWATFVYLFCIYGSICPIIALIKRKIKRQNDEMEAFRQREIAWCREQLAKYRKESNDDEVDSNGK